jgi:hypothetical protein
LVGSASSLEQHHHDDDSAQVHKDAGDDLENGQPATSQLPSILTANMLLSETQREESAYMLPEIGQVSCLVES